MTNLLSASVEVFYAPFTGEARPATAEQPMVQSVRRILQEELGVEMWLAEPGRRPLSEESVAELREICRATTLPVTAHTGIERWNPEALRAEIRIGADIGIRQLVIHRTTLGLNAPDFPAIAELAGEAADLGITLALENSTAGMTVIRPALEAVPTLALCLDTGHAGISMWRDGMSPAAIIAAWADRLVEVHLSDNDGAHDLHVLPGAGRLDWSALLPALHGLPAHVVQCLELNAPADPLAALRAGRAFLR